MGNRMKLSFGSESTSNRDYEPPVRHSNRGKLMN